MDAPKSLDWLHDRVPVMLDTQEKVDAWLRVSRSSNHDGVEANEYADTKPDVDTKPLAMSFQSGSALMKEAVLGLTFDAIHKLCIAPVEKGIQCYEGKLRFL